MLNAASRRAFGTGPHKLSPGGGVVARATFARQATTATCCANRNTTLKPEHSELAPAFIGFPRLDGDNHIYSPTNQNPSLVFDQGAK
jgi:hypothetical protein